MNITDINNAAGGSITDLPSHYLVIDDSGLARLVTPGPDTLSDIQTLVDGYVECVGLPGGIDAWVNEEGLLRNPQDFMYNYIATDIVREWTGQPYDLVGPCVFTSNDGKGATNGCLAGFTIDTLNKGMELTPRHESDHALLLFHTVKECADLMAESRKAQQEAVDAQMKAEAEGEMYADFGMSWIHGGGHPDDVRQAWSQHKADMGWDR